MSNQTQIIDERSSDIGGFLVGRLLPFRRKRMVGPFIFVDHMGPATVGPPDRYVDVGQHPHIGLSTLTYLLEGELLHRDSIGSEQRIRPGAVNWMTAGRGIVHTERTPDDLKNGHSRAIHGYQIWVALPAEMEDMAPSFHHTPASELPAWAEGPLQFKLIAGEAYGRRSPVPVHSALFLLDVQAEADTRVQTGGNLFGEIGIVVVAGAVEADETRVDAGQLLVAKATDTCSFRMQAGTRVLLFGGAPFPERRFIDWNFVSSGRATIEAAKERWRRREFEMVPGDTSYIPLPPQPRNLRRT